MFFRLPHSDAQSASTRSDPHFSADKSIQLICAKDSFDALPHLVRKLGPWAGAGEGELENLKPHYRAQFDEQAFALVYLPTSKFTPKTS